MLNPQNSKSGFPIYLFDEPFSFISPLPLEDCAERLRSKSEPVRFFRLTNPLKVNVDQIDADAYQFELRRDAGRNLIVQAVGVLERGDAGTRVSGHGQFYRFTLVLILILFAVQFPFFLPTFGPGILGVDALLIIVFWVFMAIERHRLVQMLPNILGSVDPNTTLIPLSVMPQPRRRYQKPLRRFLVEAGCFAVVALFLLSIGYGFFNSTTEENEFCSIQPNQPRPVLSGDLTLRALWSTKVGIDFGSGRSGIAIAAGKVFTQNCSDVTAFDLKTGQQLWVAERIGEGPGGVSGQLTVDAAHNLIYARKNQWGIRAFSMSDGKIAWTNEMSGVSRAMPYLDLLSDGRVLAQDNGQAWYVDPRTGALQSTTPFAAYGNVPQVIDGTTLVQCEICLRAKSQSGTVLWQFSSSGNELVSNAAVWGHTIFIMDQHAKVFFLDLVTGKQLGTVQFEYPKNQENLLYQSGQIGGSSIAVSGNIIAVYFQDTTTLTLYALDRMPR